FNSDINRFGRAFAMGSPLEDFCKTLKQSRKPGSYCHYVSIDTQVLGMLLAKVTGKSLTENLQEKLWNPMGMEYPAEWITDNTGFELALGGLNITLRDYAKLGQLYLHNGRFNGKQLVSESWIKAATTPDANHLMPGEHDLSSHHFGYGYQWWIPQDDYGAFFAAGIYNQFIYIQPNKDLVIVKLSANHHFKKEGSVTKDIHMAMFKAMAEAFGDEGTKE
ncbi:MAG: CubicO group peptidase (beta-lactamase class C family), partial [Saprospiraceae bacterium]